MKRVGWLSPLVLAVGLTAVGCSGDDRAANADERRACGGTIGLMAPLSGSAASVGQQQRNWAGLAVSRYNARRGTSFTLREGDTALDPGQATAVAEGFAADQSLLAVVGPASGQEVEAVGETYERQDVAMVSPSATASSLTDGRFRTFHRVVPSEEHQASAVTRHLRGRLGADHILIVDDQTPYSRDLAAEVEEDLEDAAAEDVDVDGASVLPQQQDFSSLVGTIESDVDVVFLPWRDAARAMAFARQLEASNPDVVIFGSEGLFSPLQFVAEGAYVASFAPDVRAVDPAAEVVAEYVAQHGDRFDTFGPPAFVAATVVMTAAEQACSGDGEVTRREVLDQVGGTELEQSVLGYPVRFDDDGDLEGVEFFVFKVDKGQYELST